MGNAKEKTKKLGRPSERQRVGERKEVKWKWMEEDRGRNEK